MPSGLHPGVSRGGNGQRELWYVVLLYGNEVLACVVRILLIPEA
jgi:hypothetical protein